MGGGCVGRVAVVCVRILAASLGTVAVIGATDGAKLVRLGT